MRAWVSSCKPTRLFSKVTREMGADIEGWYEVCASCIDAARAADAERDGWMTVSPRIGPFPQGGLDEALGLAVGLR